MEAATDPLDLLLSLLYLPLPFPEFDLEYTTDFDLAWRCIFKIIFSYF